MIKVKFYLSHPIRGIKGKDATATDMKRNNDAAKAVAHYIRNNIAADIEIYVPAEHEDFVGRAYQKCYLTVKQILDIDCSIIDDCNVVLLFNPEDIIVAGCKIEKEHAEENNIPVMIGRTAQDLLNKVTQFILRS